MTDNFADLGVSSPIVRALAARGIERPFPVQSLATRDVLDGRDVLVQSPTGSGKTLAFGVPMLDRIAADARRPAGLVLAPTRELARQIIEELEPLARSRALKMAVVYGGVGIEPQIRRAPRSHVLVATPGRLEDLIERGAVSLAHVGLLVLDEADRMLDMGFKPAVDRIVRLLPASRQTLFFSATLEGPAGKLAASYTRDARRHVNAPKAERRPAIAHRFVQVETQGAKLDRLVAELGEEDCDRALVFVRTKRGADRLVKKLRARHVDAVAMHGDKSQSQRQKALARFDRGEVRVLVATDVAARGIDVPEISHVVQFDAPVDGDTYTHRTGRTGRAGRGGHAVSFVLDDQAHELRGMVKRLGLAAEFDRREGGRHHGGAPAARPGHGRGRRRRRRPNRV